MSLLRTSEQSTRSEGSGGIDAQVARALLGAFIAVSLLATAVSLAGLSIERSESMEALVWVLSLLLAVPVGVFVAVRVIRNQSSEVLTAAAGPMTALFGTGLLISRILSVDWAMSGAIFLVAIPTLAAGVLGYRLLSRWTPALLSMPLTQGFLIFVGSVCVILTFTPAKYLTVDIVIPSILIVILGIVVLSLTPTLSHEFPGLRNRGVRTALASVVSLSIACLAWGVAYRPNWYDQNFFLGPANEIRNGRFMLVEVVSQYGVGVMYVVEGALSVLGFGYGSLLLLTGLLWVVTLLVIYSVLAATTRSIGWATTGTLCVAIAGPIMTLYWSEWFPSTGFLRFGPTWILILALTLTVQRSQLTIRTIVPSALIMGIASVWSFESAFYSFGTFSAVVITVSWSRRQLRQIFNFLAVGLIAGIVALFLLVTWTLIGSGQLPNPGGYIEFIRLYSSQGFGTLPVADWSFGYLIAGAYMASFSGIGFALVRLPMSNVMSPRVAVPLVATTTFGFLAFTYFLGRSHPNNLTHISPPFIVMMTIWTWLAATQWTRSRQPAYLAFVSAVFFGASLLVVGQLENVSSRFPDSALAAVLSPVTGSPSLTDRISTLRSNPVVSPRAQTIESLVQRYVPADQPLLILAEPSLLTESLIRLDRINTIPLSAPDQDALLPNRRKSLIDQSSSLPCDTWLVVQPSVTVRANSPETVLLLREMLANIRSSYDLTKIADENGFQILRARCKP